MLTIQDINENKKRYAKLDTQSFQYFRAAVLDSEEGIVKFKKTVSDKEELVI